MKTGATAEETTNTTQGAITVTIGRDAANQAGVVAVSSHESLESLQRKHGPPKGVFVHLAFQTYDANEGIARGRKVATTRILQAVPGFAQQAAACWEALPPELRGRVVGFHPGLIAVLLGEAVALRDVNLRYDARALAEGTQRGASEAAARDALNTGRSLFEQTLRIARRWAPVAYVARNPLPAYVEGGADKPDVLALSGDALASWITAWRATWSEEEREGYESLNFAPDQAERLHEASARVRETQSVVAAFSDTSPITQRELDAQDGRVLHVVDLIQAAFRQAAQGDARVMVPELGELASLYERPAKRGAAEAKEPEKEEAKGEAKEPEKNEAKPEEKGDAKPTPR
jgi:hypothetical protein